MFSSDMLANQTRAIHFEDVPSDSQACFTLREFQWPAFPFNWHFHPELELTLIVKGRGLRFVDDSVQEFTEGDLCLLGANTPHCWASHANAPKGVHSLVIHFSPQAWGEFFWRLPEMRGVWRLFDLAGRGLVFHGAVRQEVSQMIWELTRDPHGSFSRLIAFLQVLERLANNKTWMPLASEGHKNPPSRQVWDKIGRILQVIHANLGPDLDQAGVARAMGMSAQAFSQFFRRSMGKTYVDYINELKIRQVCRALLETEDTITEVAYACGFNNLSHFNTQFRRFKQMTPREFREAARGGVMHNDLPSATDWLGALK
jgi:AraC-like DNA-binding protein